MNLLVQSTFLFLLLVATSQAQVTYKLVGNETRLVNLKANPAEHRDKIMYVTGAAEISDYFNYGYDSAEDTHYAFSFKEALNDMRTGGFPNGQRVNLYLSRSRTNSRQIVDQIAARAPKSSPIRVVVGLLRDRWDMLELVDVQFPKEDGSWGDWYMEAAAAREEAAAAEAKKREDQLAAEAAAEEAARRAAIEKLKWRTWTSANGNFNVFRKRVDQI